MFGNNEISTIAIDEVVKLYTHLLNNDIPCIDGDYATINGSMLMFTIAGVILSSFSYHQEVVIFVWTFILVALGTFFLHFFGFFSS